MEVLEAAAEEVGGDWVTLPWNHETRQLVHNSYGHRLDVSLFYIDGRCPECHRRFVYEAGEQEGEPPTFRVELKAE